MLIKPRPSSPRRAGDVPARRGGEGPVPGSQMNVRSLAGRDARPTPNPCIAIPTRPQQHDGTSEGFPFLRKRQRSHLPRGHDFAGLSLGTE